MVFRGRDRDAVVTLTWQAGPACWLAWTAEGRGSSDLATWGRTYLEAPEKVTFRVTRTSCELPADEDVPATLAIRIDEAPTGHATLGGEEVAAAAPVLVRTLFGLVAESYAYLLE